MNTHNPSEKFQMHEISALTHGRGVRVVAASYAKCDGRATHMPRPLAPDMLCKRLILHILMYLPCSSSQKRSGSASPSLGGRRAAQFPRDSGPLTKQKNPRKADSTRGT